MGRRRWMKKNKRDGTNFIPRFNEEHNTDPITRLLSVHPSDPIVAVAVGCHLRVHNYETGEQRKLGSEGEAPHSMAIRILAFSPDGTCLLSGGDDKRVLLWDTATGVCRASWLAPKKVTYCTFTRDGNYILFADKFGDVLTGKVPSAAAVSVSEGDKGPGAQPYLETSLVLGHFSTIITHIALSADSRLIATSDKEHRVKVSVLPEDPRQGSVEIVSFCLGHTSFVTSCAFLQPPGCPPLLVSGGGDTTVRLWDPMTGQQLDMLTMPAEQAASNLAAGPAEASESVSRPGAEGEDATAASCGQQENDDEAEESGPEGDEEEEGGTPGPSDGPEVADDGDGGGRRDTCTGPAVLAVAVAAEGCTVAAVVEGESKVVLLRVDASTRKLSLLQVVPLPAVFSPCSACFDSRDQLWVAGGAPVNISASAHLAVLQDTGDCCWAEVTERVLGAGVRESMEQRDAAEEADIAAGKFAPAATKHLKRLRIYSADEIAARKSNRNDRKEAQRLTSSTMA